MLIRNAEIWGFGIGDLRIANGKISEVGALGGVADVDARGGALLPGLHDHHIHLAAEAMARLSISCGPPDVCDEEQLAAALNVPGEGWLRGIGYHESVAGLLSTDQLDAMQSTRPVRIQHRSGRMWFFNSIALDLLLANAEPSPGLEQKGVRYTGRLFDDDTWVRKAATATPPSLAAVSASLARYGVTGVTDMSVANQPSLVTHLVAEQASGAFAQKLLVAGRLDLIEALFTEACALGPSKLHLHEWALPDLDQTMDFVRAAHDQGRAVASHCTTEIELAFTLAALEGAGTRQGDRIEHASIVTEAALEQLARLGLHIVTQPHFIAERGKQYLRDVEPKDHPDLYRLASFQRAGIVIAGGSDAPYGRCDPWASMRAAIDRLTSGGMEIGASEALSREQALALYLADPDNLAVQRKLEVGAPADLCLLDRPWAQARLSEQDVRMTIINGSIAYNRIDQAPV